MKFLTIAPGHVTRFPVHEGVPERAHQFDRQSIEAVNAALAAKRPLLVRGEPGVGKTQLAEAAAIELDRAFVPFTVDARTESRDLLWRFDAVERLAQAQLRSAGSPDWDKIKDELAERNFVRPGPLWWAFNATTAKDASRGATPLDQLDNAARAAKGWVVLIDEIDKAESDVPNGLLEALGGGQFTPFGHTEPVRATGVAPLIVITTNEERTLPNAFLRRCLVLGLTLPSDEQLVDHLAQRGRAHFGTKTTDEVLQEAARQLVTDRKYAEEHELNPKPGQAEYLDLMRAVIALAPEGDIAQQKALLATVAQFTLRKHLNIP